MLSRDQRKCAVMHLEFCIQLYRVCSVDVHVVVSCAYSRSRYSGPLRLIQLYGDTGYLHDSSCFDSM